MNAALWAIDEAIRRDSSLRLAVRSIGARVLIGLWLPAMVNLDSVRPIARLQNVTVVWEFNPY